MTVAAKSRRKRQTSGKRSCCAMEAVATVAVAQDSADDPSARRFNLASQKKPCLGRASQGGKRPKGGAIWACWWWPNSDPYVESSPKCRHLFRFSCLSNSAGNSDPSRPDRRAHRNTHAHPHVGAITWGRQPARYRCGGVVLPPTVRFR